MRSSSCRTVGCCARSESSARISTLDVARASCTARWAFLRLMPRNLHIVPSLKFFIWPAYWLRASASVSSTGACSPPSGANARFMNAESNAALCATSTAPGKTQ